MNWTIISISVAAIAFSIIFSVLLWYNYRKLVTFNDFSTPAVQNITSGPIVSPYVYQLVYQSSSGTTWTFENSDEFKNDWIKARVNNLLIAGTLYTITAANFPITNDKMILTLTASCNNTSSSFVGSTCDAKSLIAKSTLLVLGYKFTSQV